MNIKSQAIIYQNCWDHAGIGASFLCVLHCLVTPFLITAIPVLAATEHQTHSVFAIIILLFGLLAFIPGYRKHQKKSIPMLGGLGAAMIIMAAELPEIANAETLETGLVLIGGSTLIFAHIRNVYWCRFCKKCMNTCCTTTEENFSQYSPK